jgi:hypothetical protein
VAVTIVVRKKAGKAEVKRLVLGKRPTGRNLAASFRCRLKPGVYTYSVLATDRAGNTQVRAGTRSLVVR